MDPKKTITFGPHATALINSGLDATGFPADTAAPSPWDTLCAHLDRLLDALDRLEADAAPVLRVDGDSEKTTPIPAPSSALDDRVRWLGALVDRLNAITDRIDL